MSPATRRGAVDDAGSTVPRSAGAPDSAKEVRARVVRAREPFALTLRLTLGASGEAPRRAVPERLAYHAVVQVRPVGGGPRRLLAGERGVMLAARPRIRIGCAGLPAGAYRLDTAVALCDPDTADLAALGVAERVLLIMSGPYPTG